MIVSSSSFKIIELISSLTDAELRSIRKMLTSGYFTSRSHLKKLFDALHKEVSKGKPKLQVEYIFKQVYPSLDFDYSRLRKAMSDLLIIIEEGLIISSYKANPIASNLSLLQIYRHRNLDKCYRSKVKKVEAAIAAEPLRNSNYFQNLTTFQSEVFRNKLDSRQIDHHSVQNHSDAEDLLFLTKKLRLACAQLSHQLILNHPYDFGLLTQLLVTIEQEKYLKVPAVALYFYCYKFLSEPDSPEYFKKYKTTLNEHQDVFTIEDLSDSYRSAINYCIRKNNEGDVSFMRELWELYKYGLAQKILLVDNELPRFTFDNALTAGLRLKEFAWAESFIHDQSVFLNPVYREQSILFNLGKLAYEQQDYQSALTHLRTIEFKEIRINIVGKIMLMKIFYELNSFDALDAHLEAFRQLIRRKEVSDYHKKNILNISSCLKRIISLAPSNSKERAQLRQKIQAEEILSERDWLLLIISKKR